ncbi:choice-of-anchor tandem repeat GloVer-containing protein [Candidatus Auribacterota bacterium]
MTKMLTTLIISIVLVLALVAWAFAGTFTILHNFTGSDGNSPINTTLTLTGGKLYGMTGLGGASSSGTIFSVDTDGSNYTVLYSLLGGNDSGSIPYGDLTLSGDVFYGMTFGGGASGGSGTIFEIGTDGSGFTLLHSFSSTDPANGKWPYGSVTLSGDTLYGMSYAGGESSNGTVFSIVTDGTGFTLLRQFGADGPPPPEGATPRGDLTLIGSTLYGMTKAGGNGNGVIFSVGTNGSSFTLLRTFVAGSGDGSQPYGDLVLSNGAFYGMTYAGGDTPVGTVFSMDTDGSNFTLLHDFSVSDGGWPRGNPTIVGDTIYGMTYQGSTNNKGNIFSVGTDGSGFTVLYEFAGGADDGAEPRGTLTYNEANSTFYGMTFNGGTSEMGVVFSFSMGAGEVPEPSTLLILIPLLGGLYWMRKRSHILHGYRRR